MHRSRRKAYAWALRASSRARRSRQRLIGRHTGIAFAVPDLDAAYRELAAKRVRFTLPPTKQPWGGYLATFADPDGNIFYLDQLRSE